ncbi:MAG: hypothetical protein WCO26_20310 [Deltaproteobacteria bacterium]
MKSLVEKWLAIVLMGLIVECVKAGINFGDVITGTEPELLVDKCGKGDPVVVSNGYLFVECRYVPAPYTIQRVGQAVVVNGMVANCLYTGNILTNRPALQIGADGKPFWQMREKDMASDLKSAASINIDSLLRKLKYNVVLLSKSGYMAKNHYMNKPVTEAGMMMRLPRVGEFKLDGFAKVIEHVSSEQSDSKALEILKLGIGTVLNDEELSSLIRNLRECQALKERVRSEKAEKEKAKTH